MFTKSFLSTKLKIVATLFLIIGFLTILVPSAKADSLPDMQAQLADLLVQLQQLQSQLETLSTASPLTMGHGSSLGPRFVIGDYVQTTGIVDIRASSTTSSALLGQQPAGVKGIIMEGPVFGSGGATRYRVDYETGIDGWTHGAKLRRVSQTQTSGLSIGSKIVTHRQINIHASTGTSSPSIGKQPRGAIGTIVAIGTVQNQGFTWYKIDFETGVDGWIRIHRNFPTIGPLRWCLAPVQGSPGGPQPPRFSIGSKIQIKADQTLSISASTSTSSPSIGTQSGGARGTIVAIVRVQNPRSTWYNIDFETGVDGWIRMPSRGLPTIHLLRLCPLANTQQGGGSGGEYSGSPTGAPTGTTGTPSPSGAGGASSNPNH